MNASDIIWKFQTNAEIEEKRSGNAYKTVSDRFGFPEQYLVTLSKAERLLVIKALEAYGDKP